MTEAVLCAACGAIMRMKKPWLYRCAACGFLASTLRPGEGTGIAGLEDLRRGNFEIMLDRLEEMQPLAGTRILEVGSAWGWFLEAAQRRGARICGIEPEEANAELARRKGLAVETGFFPEDLRDRGPYDVIVFNDVFEHLHDPSAIARETAGLLNPSGMVVLNLPSSGGILFKLATLLDAFGASSWLERLWQKGFPSPHVSYFNPRNLRLLVEKHTDMTCARTFSLESVSRDGLAARISSSHRPVACAIAFAGVWVLSFALPVLPSDIHVSVFRKPDRLSSPRAN
jgi:2-polyprenyl-3-methyl-5-hydroxy-6-metoxy-1,4-benzoquinol methylase